LRSGRGALVAEFAAKHGFVFTLADLIAVTDAFQRVRSNELSTDEFDKFLSLEVKSKDFFPAIENVVSMTYKGVSYSAPVTAKSKDNTLPVIRFMELSGTDEALRSKQVVKLGGKYGYRFIAADLGAVVGAFQMVSSGKLPAESCARILGLGKSDDAVSSVKKAAGMMYRGVAY
jgi:hypothetical protein